MFKYLKNINFFLLVAFLCSSPTWAALEEDDDKENCPPELLQELLLQLQKPVSKETANNLLQILKNNKRQRDNTEENDFENKKVKTNEAEVPKTPEGAKVHTRYPNGYVDYTTPNSVKLKNSSYRVATEKVFGEAHVPLEDKTNVQEVLEQVGNNLSEALLITETRILTWLTKKLKSKAGHIEKTIYVGQTTKTTGERGGQHAREIDDIENELSSKPRYSLTVTELNFHRCRSALLYNVPEEHKLVFEGLLAYIFDAELLGYLKHVASSEAKDILKEYFKWEKRVNELKARDLHDLTNKLRNQSIENHLNMSFDISDLK